MRRRHAVLALLGEVVADWEYHCGETLCESCYGAENGGDEELTKADGYLWDLENPTYEPGCHQASGCQHWDGYCFYDGIPERIEKVREWMEAREAGTKTGSFDILLEELAMDEAFLRDEAVLGELV